MPDMAQINDLPRMMERIASVIRIQMETRYKLMKMASRICDMVRINA